MPGDRDPTVGFFTDQQLGWREGLFGMEQLPRRTRGRVGGDLIRYDDDEICGVRILGVMPNFNAEQQWSATAFAHGDVELLKFSWQEYMALLKQRLTQEEQGQFVESLKANAKACFLH